jgi:restriction endonuclease Mrr
MAAAFEEIDNIDWDAVPDPTATVRFEPIVVVVADIDAVFETSVGVIQRIDQRGYLILNADRGPPSLADSDITALVGNNSSETMALDEEKFGGVFEEIEVKRFGKSQTEYQKWAVGQFRERYTTTVRYTGDNNVTYTKTCEPNLSDVIVQSIDPVYLPRIELSTDLQSYTYSLSYNAAGSSREIDTDRVRRCVQCGTTAEDETYTYCENCGSINCRTHIHTERLIQKPVCTGCAVTEEFVWKTKYFYDEENLQQFRVQYNQLPIYKKIFENRLLAIGILVVLGILGLVLLFMVVATV